MSGVTHGAAFCCVFSWVPHTTSELCSPLPLLPTWLPLFLTATSRHDTINGWYFGATVLAGCVSTLPITTATKDVPTSAEKLCGSSACRVIAVKFNIHPIQVRIPAVLIHRAGLALGYCPGIQRGAEFQESSLKALWMLTSLGVIPVLPCSPWENKVVQVVSPLH